MITQKFKGDDIELRMEAAGLLAIEACSIGLDDYFEQGYNAADFLLMLYDEGRMPFSDRVPRDSFVEFIREALLRFPFVGTFESYIFILEKIFGDGSSVVFDVPAPGKLEMLVNAASSIEYDLYFKEVIEGNVVESRFIDSVENLMVARGISGIDSEYELQLLLAEIIPAGIYPDITLSFFELYDFIDADDNTIQDHLGNQIVFIET